jgi:putative PIN family toxin of toxin-antitoxin system
VRIALDTNVLISAFATRGLSADVLNLILADHQLILGEAVLGEFARILRTKLKVPADVVAETTGFLRTQAVVISSAPPLELSIRYPDDLLVLSEAVHGLAEVLVTGDQDLLSLARQAPIRILDPRGLWELLRADPGS